LPAPQTFEFSLPGFVNVNLARNSLDLYEMKTGKKAGHLDPDQVSNLERGYVGKQVTLTVYETGGYSGVPKNLPAGVIWQDRSFAFRTYLVVLAEMK
jgi:hypothetical protein